MFVVRTRAGANRPHRPCIIRKCRLQDDLRHTPGKCCSGENNNRGRVRRYRTKIERVPHVAFGLSACRRKSL